MRAVVIRACGLLLSIALSAPALAADGPAPAVGTVRLEPADIPVTTFYRSTTVQIEGRLPAGYDAAVVCSGVEHSLSLKKKGKVWGLLWMTVGEITFEHVPTLYQVVTSRDLAELAGPATLAEFGLGYQALRARSDAKAPDVRMFFDELLKLKQSEGLFAERPGAVELEPGDGQDQVVRAECTFPAKASPGDYTVELFGFSAGRAERFGSAKLTVHREGFTAFVVSLAEQHGLLYGILAVVIALVVGLLTGLAFGLGSKGGH